MIRLRTLPARQDLQDRFSTINARAEEVDTKPAFREAFRQRRCLVPLDSVFTNGKKSAPASSLMPSHSPTGG
jgi:putative SOS response-associated peptidase YedK